jgi:NADPH:quinone reductase-like Zn-dependent oxidoreductase
MQNFLLLNGNIFETGNPNPVRSVFLIQNKHQNMKAIILNDFGDASKLVLSELPVPEIKADEVLIRVKAISINPIDVKTRSGKGLAESLKTERPLVLGWDVSGIVQEAGEKVSQFKVGDEVFGMANFPGHGKAYAEYVAAPAAHLAKKPVNISFEEAAAGTLAALTAWQALTLHAQIVSGQRVLIHAASGGVGHFAVQIAKHFGAKVIGTSSAANRDFVLSLGADQHVDYQSQKLEETVGPVDLVLDGVGGETIDHSLEVLKEGGTIISLPSGKNEMVAETAAAKGRMGKRMRVESSGTDMQKLAALFENGELRAYVSKTYRLEEMAEAHRQIESGHTVGKIVVKLFFKR